MSPRTTVAFRRAAAVKGTILFFVLVQGTAGCGGSEPTAPTPAPSPVQLAAFTDAGSGFSTSDVRDVHEQIVRFNILDGSLIWTADGRNFSGYPVSGNFLGADRSFQVRFGTVDGQRRAYFTETVATTICDIEVVNGQLRILPTAVSVPGT